MKKKIITATFIAILAIMLTRCGHRNLSWTEETKLESGKIINVKRTAKLKRISEIGGPGGWEREEMTLSINQSEKQIKPWKSKYDPMIIDFDKNKSQWFIVASIHSCDDWRTSGKPSLPYIEFIYRDNIWIQQNLSENNIGKKANLLVDINAEHQRNETIESKEKLNSNLTIPDYYLYISRKWSNNC